MYRKKSFVIILSDLDMLNHFGIGRQTKAELYNENRHHVYQN
jgi:hypothetical protein